VRALCWHAPGFTAAPCGLLRVHRIRVHHLGERLPRGWVFAWAAAGPLRVAPVIGGAGGQW